MEIVPCSKGESDITDRTALYASGRRKARFHRRFDVRPVIASHRWRVQKRIARVLRQIAILVIDRVALHQHATACAVVADPADDAAPGDVLTVERLEIDRAAIPHVNDLGCFPGRGEEQSEDEGKTGHDVVHRQGAAVCAFGGEPASACARQATRT
jgi:hypothetical protein